MIEEADEEVCLWILGGGWAGGGGSIAGSWVGTSGKARVKADLKRNIQQHFEIKMLILRGVFEPKFLGQQAKICVPTSLVFQ